MARQKRGTCDQCGKRRVIRFANVAKQFCTAKCANEYLAFEGFTYRVSENDISPLPYTQREKNNV